MSTASPTPATPMAPTADSQPDPPATAASPAAGTASRPARRALLGDNPTQTVLGAALVGLLIFSLTSNRSRIDRLEDTITAQFAAQDAKIDSGFDELDDRMDELELKLTALIAGLDMADEVNAAVEGGLLTSGASPHRDRPSAQVQNRAESRLR